MQLGLAGRQRHTGTATASARGLYGVRGAEEPRAFPSVTHPEDALAGPAGKRGGESRPEDDFLPASPCQTPLLPSPPPAEPARLP